MSPLPPLPPSAQHWASTTVMPDGADHVPEAEKVTVVMALPLGGEGGARSLDGYFSRKREHVSYRSDTATPAAETLNVFPLATEIGCPVHDPNRYRTESAEFHTSIPTIDQDPPDPFVHEAVDALLVAAADAEFHVITVPPVVYPVPVSSVMFAVAVGALVPSRVFTVAEVVNELLCKIALSRLPAVV